MDKKEKTILFVLAAGLCCLLIACAVVALVRPAPDGGTFVPPSFDSAAIPGVPEIPEGLDYRNLDIKEGYRVSMCVNPTLEDGSVPLYFTADAANTLWVSAMILSAEGDTLGRTGLLKPGEYVELVALENPPQESGEILVKILSYDPKTYYSLGVANAQILLNVEK